MKDKLPGASDEVAAAVSALAARALAHADEDPNAVSRVATLFESGARIEELERLLLALVPQHVDVAQWHAWLDAASRAPTELRLSNPDSGRKPAARGALVSAAKKRDEAAATVADLEEKLALAKSTLAQATEEAAAADSHLRKTVAYRVLTDLSALMAGVFAMGPAWTIMRSVSRYVRPTPEVLDAMTPDARARVQPLIDNEGQDSSEMLDLLDRYTGDVLLELRLRDRILKTLREHHKQAEVELANRHVPGFKLSPAAKRLSRRSEDRNTSVRAGLADRHDVLAGLVPPSPPTDARDAGDALDEGG